MVRLLVLIAIVTLTSCSHVRSPSPPASPTDSGVLFVAFRHFGCYRGCPIYSVHVHRNGEARYVGEFNVATLGRKDFQLSRADLAELNNALKAARLETQPVDHTDGQPTCIGSDTDQDTMTLTVVREDRWSTFDYYFGCPEIPEMIKLDEDIERVVERHVVIRQPT